MHRGHYIFETVLISITLFCGLCSMLSTEMIMFGYLWLFVLGVLQVAHSFVLGVLYWQNTDARKNIIIYWVLAAADLTVLLIDNKTSHNGVLQAATILVFPMCLAAYLWLITFLYKRAAFHPVAKSLRID